MSRISVRISSRLSAAFIAMALAFGGLIAAPILTAPPAGAALGAPITRVFLDSEPGDTWVGGGVQRDISDANATVNTYAANSNWLSVQFFPNGGGFVNMTFEAPVGQTLAVGTYEPTHYAPGPTNAGLDIGVDGHGCSDSTGRFVVDDLALSGPPATQTIDAFSARFEFHCESGDPALFGQVSFHSTANFRTRSITPDPIAFPATAIGATSAPLTATVTNNGPSSLTVSSAGITGADAGSFAMSSNTCTVVASGASCTIGVTFSPTKGGANNATLTVFDDLAPTGGTGRDIALAGSGLAPDGEFTPLTPARIVDTRDGTGGQLGKLGAGASFDFQIDGQGGVPASGVSAVVLNATVTQPTATAHLTIWPTGFTRPTISNLNYTVGQTVPNLVTIAVGTDGKVSAYNNTGATHLIFDVVGYYSDDSGPFGSRFHAITPSRSFDTRDGTGGVPARPRFAEEILKFNVTGKNGVPASDVTSVVMNVTVTSPGSVGHITVYPDDVSRPVASNLNFVTGLTVPNLVIVRVPASGIVDFYTHTDPGQTTHLLADVVGYFDGDKSTEAGRLVTGVPARLIDTRVSSPAPPPGCIPGGAGLTLTFASDEVDSWVLNTTVTGPTAPGHVTVFPLPPPPPLASNLNFVPGQTVPNLVMVKVGVDRKIGFYNSNGCTHLVVDAFGYFTSASSPAPSATAASRGAEPYGEVTASLG